MRDDPRERCLEFGLGLFTADPGEVDEVALDAYDATTGTFDSAADTEHRPDGLTGLGDSLSDPIAWAPTPGLVLGGPSATSAPPG